MTGSVPFDDLPRDENIIARVVTGTLPSITNNLYFTHVKALCVVMARCWAMDPGKRPDAVECEHHIDWMVWFQGSFFALCPANIELRNEVVHSEKILAQPLMGPRRKLILL